MQMFKVSGCASMVRAAVFALLGILVSACATDQHYWAPPLAAVRIQEVEVLIASITKSCSRAAMRWLSLSRPDAIQITQSKKFLQK